MNTETQILTRMFVFDSSREEYFHLVVLVDANVSINKNQRNVSTDDNPM